MTECPLSQVYMELPTTVADPVKRMRAVHERTDAMKKSPAAYINHYFGNFFYGMPLFTYFVNGFFKVLCVCVCRSCSPDSKSWLGL